MAFVPLRLPGECIGILHLYFAVLGFCGRPLERRVHHGGDIDAEITGGIERCGSMVTGVFGFAALAMRTPIQCPVRHHTPPGQPIHRGAAVAKTEPRLADRTAIEDE